MVKGYDLDAHGNIKQPDETRKRAKAMDWPLGLAALAFGIPLWGFGALYTLDGWVIVLNIVTFALRIPAQIPSPTHWWILLFIPLGLVYSYVEVHRRPGTPRPPLARWIVHLLVFALIIGSDYGTTLVGVATPAANAWLIERWLANTPLAIIVWSAVVTFAPEALIMTGIYWLHNRS